MKFRAAAATLLMLSLVPASARVRIYDDRGGQIGEYLAKYQALKKSGEPVEIDGTCASACTMLLGIIPASRLCATAQAVLEFHTAWDLGPSGNQIANSAGNQILWSYYPDNVRQWITRHGGLQPQILYLRGSELAAMVPICKN
jgi:hypothetical protein